MGGGSWSSRAYVSSAKARKAAGVDDFEYSRRVRSGKASGVSEVLDPRKIGPLGRESRDSDEHPESVPIAVIFDVTGSMMSVPEVMQRKLKNLMEVIVSKTGLSDAQILYGAVGDTFSDRYPFQVGQFESDNKSDEQLRQVILEGGGGGGNHESYQLALYFAAHKTALDSYEKRGKKGYLFTIGDEKSYTEARRDEISDVFGDQVDADIPLKDLVGSTAQTWNHFHLIPENTSYRGDAGVRKFWQKYLGERVVSVSDEHIICEVIAGLVYMLESSLDLDTVADNIDLTGRERDAFKNALVPFADATVPARVAKGKVPSRSKKKSGVSRI